MSGRRMSRRFTPGQSNSGNIKITGADIAQARKDAPAALDYYKNFGLKEIQSRSLNLIISGAMPIFGLAFLSWSTLSMLVFIIVDAVITVLADLVRYPLASKWIAECHKMDHSAGRVLLVFDGLEDGSGKRADTGHAMSPGVLLIIGILSSIFLVPILGAATEKIGIAPLLEIVSQRSFYLMLGIDAVWRIGSALWNAIWIRKTAPGEEMIFMEAGSVAVLYVGLLTLVWLPLSYGNLGLIIMIIVFYLVRIAFGIFAYLWTPRAIRVIERRLKEGDFTIKKKEEK